MAWARAAKALVPACAALLAQGEAAHAGAETTIEKLERRIEEVERRREEDARTIEDLRKELKRLETRQAASEQLQEPLPRVLPEQLNAFNPTLTVFGNALWRLDDQPVFLEEDGERERIDDVFNLRETELDLRAAVDPYADGVLIVALESELPGEFEVAIEEGFARIKNIPFLERPPLGLVLKAGRFRTESGRFNRLHTHDLPQSTRPLAVEAFLGAEGYATSGLSGRILLPSILDRGSVWELTGQVLQGGEIAVAEDGTRDPALLTHLRWSRIFADEHFADISGIFHWGRGDENGRTDVLTYSLDALYEWQPLRAGQWRSFLLGGQIFYSDRELLVEEEGGGAGTAPVEARITNRPLGAFAFAQMQLNRRFFIGTRGDWVQDVDDDSRERWAVHPYASYYFSEFLRVRLGYEHRWSDLDDEDGRDTLFTELNFVFGSHPPHPFWTNR